MKEADAFQETYWNRLQALGWIQTRQKSVVGRLSEKVTDFGSHEEEYKIPGGGIEFGHVVAEKPDFTFADTFAHRMGLQVKESPTRAKELLIESLATGRIIATGYNHDEGDRQEVPAIFWIDAEFGPSPDTAQPKRWPASSIWRNLKFKRIDVLALWPSGPENLIEPPNAENEAQGRKPSGASRGQEILKAFDKLVALENPTGRRGELTAIAKRIANDFGYSDRGVRKIIGPSYWALPATESHPRNPKNL